MPHFLVIRSNTQISLSQAWTECPEFKSKGKLFNCRGGPLTSLSQGNSHRAVYRIIAKYQRSPSMFERIVGFICAVALFFVSLRYSFRLGFVSYRIYHAHFAKCFKCLKGLFVSKINRRFAILERPHQDRNICYIQLPHQGKGCLDADLLLNGTYTPSLDFEFNLALFKRGTSEEQVIPVLRLATDPFGHFRKYEENEFQILLNYKRDPITGVLIKKTESNRSILAQYFAWSITKDFLKKHKPCSFEDHQPPLSEDAIPKVYLIGDLLLMNSLPVMGN